MEALNRISLYSRIRGVNIENAPQILSHFGTVRQAALDTIGTTCPFFVSNAQELFEGDGFCYCDEYDVCTPENNRWHIALYYGNVSGKVVDFQMYWK